MKYNGIELKPITEVVAFEEPKEMLVWNDDTEPTILPVLGFLLWGDTTRPLIDIGSKQPQMWGYAAEIPQYDKDKFKIPHNNATYKEVLEASDMTDEEFKGFLKVGENCSGLSSRYGFDEGPSNCRGVACCSVCPIGKSNSKETIEKWMAGEDIWKPKMRDRTRDELLYFLWEKNKSECVVARYSCDEYRPYFTYIYSINCLLDYTFATIDETGKITEFEIPQVEE